MTLHPFYFYVIIYLVFATQPLKDLSEKKKELRGALKNLEESATFFKNNKKEIQKKFHELTDAKVMYEEAEQAYKKFFELQSKTSWNQENVHQYVSELKSAFQILKTN